MLKFAEEHHIEISIDEDPNGSHGVAGSAEEHRVVLSNERSDTQLSITLMHELRHAQQFEFFKRNHVDNYATFEWTCPHF